jgi:hypothetical protein
MATLLEEGIWPCVVLGAIRGLNDKDEIVVRISAKFTDGPNKGRQTTYEDAVNARSSLYIARSCKAVGWAGKTLDSLEADCAAWIGRTGGASTAEIKHIPTKKGTIWDKCNSIGRGPRVLGAPTKSAMSDADAALRAAMVADGTEAEGEPVNSDDAPF